MNPTDPAFPCGPFGDTMHGEDGRVWHQHPALPGMDIRTAIAKEIMAAFAGSPDFTAPCEEAARHAVKWADALIAELNVTKQ